MKKVISLVVMMLLGLSIAAAWAGDGEVCVYCSDKGYTDCTTTTPCPPDDPTQEDCVSVQPCNVLINICECFAQDGGLLFKDGKRIGVRLQSLTKGVYFQYSAGYTQDVKLFSEERLIDYACPAKTEHSGLTGYDYRWAGVNSLQYLDENQNRIKEANLDNSSSTYDCSDPDRIKFVDTCFRKNGWILDVTDDEYQWAHMTGDNDGDGVAGEDALDVDGNDNRILLVSVPKMTINWSEIDEEDYGSYAKLKVVILDVTDFDAALCTDCWEACYCEVDAFPLCSPPATDECMYFPYVLYGIEGWQSGLAITNMSYATVAPADMIMTITVVDSDGNVFTKTIKGTEEEFKTVMAYGVDYLINEVLGLEDVVAGPIYVKIKGNFSMDGYQFNWYVDDEHVRSYAAGTLPRECCWPDCKASTINVTLNSQQVQFTQSAQ